MEQAYVHPIKNSDYPLGTASAGAVQGFGFVISPSDVGAHTRLAVTDGSTQVVVELSLDSLKAFGAEIHRAISGCFFDKWPREKPPAAPKSGWSAQDREVSALNRDDFAAGSVGEFIIWLVEHSDPDENLTLALVRHVNELLGTAITRQS